MPQNTEGEVPQEDITPKLSCYRDQHRVCGPDCMAYLAQPPAGLNYTGENWAHCVLLVNAERSGKHLVVLANVATSLQRKLEATAIQNQKPPGVG